MVRGNWTKKMFIIGAVLDEPMLDPGYRFAMTFGAALMVGWTALLVWAAAKPVDRRAVAPLMMLVVAGLMFAESLGMASGFLPALRVWALLVFQMALIASFALAFRAASER